MLKRGKHNLEDSSNNSMKLVNVKLSPDPFFHLVVSRQRLLFSYQRLLFVRVVPIPSPSLPFLPQPFIKSGTISGTQVGEVYCATQVLELDNSALTTLLSACPLG